ncbi:MAG TPA: hypothetical protein HA326_07620 [Thermoplasmata archaeon]|nr:hypothetical protein [Thermoplasmata archaeon]
MSLFGKKFECQACGMKFNSEAELRQHGAVHMAPKPAVPQGPSCPACGVSFRSQDELKAHAQQHHGM